MMKIKGTKELKLKTISKNSSKHPPVKENMKNKPTSVKPVMTSTKVKAARQAPMVDSSKQNGGQQQESTIKKRKNHKKKSKKTDGLSNWKNLCASMEMKVERKNQPVKRKKEEAPAEEEPPKKSSRPEIWFDNVDEILLDLPVDESPSTQHTAHTSETTRGTHSVQDQTSSKLVKVDSFPGLTTCVAMDCEMVGVGEDGEESVLARVSLVNHFGVCLYDKFVLPREEVTDYRTHVSGITPENIATGEEFSKVQKEVSDIVRGRILVGHALQNDLKVLFLTHPHADVRDTSKYKPFREVFGGRIPALRKLTHKLLNVSVQEGQHSSVQDAQATMRLYTMFRQRWEKDIKRNTKTKKTQKKKKKQVLSTQTLS